MRTSKNGHTIGEHVGISNKRLLELEEEFAEWWDDRAMNNNGVMGCECDFIREIVRIGKTKEEIAVLSFFVSKQITLKMFIESKDGIELKRAEGTPNLEC